MAEKDYIKEGAALYNRGEHSSSLAYFLSLPDDCTADPAELAYYIGLCYARLKKYDDALLYLEQVVTASSREDGGSSERVLQCRYLLAVIYCITGRKNLADFELNRLLDAGYRLSSVYASLAYIAWEEGKPSVSLSYYEKSLEEDADNPTALNGMGYVLACEGTDLTKALSCCKKALDLLPESAACLDSMGWVYYKMGLYSEARTYARRAAKAGGSQPVIMEHLQEIQGAEE